MSPLRARTCSRACSKQESEPVLNVAAKQQCKQIPIFGDSTSCRVIDVWDPAVKDALTNKSFYHMLPSQVRPNNTSPTDRIVLDHLRPRVSVALPLSRSFSMYVLNTRTDAHVSETQS
jgi:hypothetical protein